MLSLKIHGAIDYAVGAFLFFVPAIFGFAEIRAAENLFRILSSLFVAYCFCTKYKPAIWRKLPLGAHLTFDLAIGVILILSPLVLGYRDLLTTGQELVHYILGFGLLAFVAATRSKTEAEKKALEPEGDRFAS